LFRFFGSAHLPSLPTRSRP